MISYGTIITAQQYTRNKDDIKIIQKYAGRQGRRKKRCMIYYCEISERPNSVEEDRHRGVQGLRL